MPWFSQTCLNADACASLGHSCWGILNGSATGKALAEMIATGASQCVDLTPYAPARLIQGTDGVRRKERTIESGRLFQSARCVLELWFLDRLDLRYTFPRMH